MKLFTIMVTIFLIGVIVGGCIFWAVQRGEDRYRKAWLQSSVKTPVHFMFQKIQADVEESDWAAAKEKLELLQNAWEEFYADSDQTERLGNILNEVNNLKNDSKKE